MARNCRRSKVCDFPRHSRGSSSGMEQPSRSNKQHRRARAGGRAPEQGSCWPSYIWQRNRREGAGSTLGPVKTPSQEMFPRGSFCSGGISCSPAAWAGSRCPVSPNTVTPLTPSRRGCVCSYPLTVALHPRSCDSFPPELGRKIQPCRAEAVQPGVWG